MQLLMFEQGLGQWLSDLILSSCLPLGNNMLELLCTGCIGQDVPTERLHELQLCGWPLVSPRDLQQVEKLPQVDHSEAFEAMLGSHLQEWLGLATKAFMRFDTLGPYPTFSPILSQGPV